MSKSTTDGRSRGDGSKERFWREAIGEQQRSGHSARAFCRHRQLNESSFYYWRKELARRDRVTRVRQDVASVLAPVVVMDEMHGDAASESPAPIEIVLRGGTTVRVPAGSTRQQLGMVLTVLQPGQC